MEAEEKRKQKERIAARKAEEKRLLGLVHESISAYRRLLKLSNKHPEWSDEDCACIAQRKVNIGFTKEQAIAAWGRPHDINRTSGPWGTDEQWVYGEFAYSCLYDERPRG